MLNRENFPHNHLSPFPLESSSSQVSQNTKYQIQNTWRGRQDDTLSEKNHGIMKSWSLSKNKRMKAKKLTGTKGMNVWASLRLSRVDTIYTDTRTICQWKKGRIEREGNTWYYMVLTQVLQWRGTSRRFPELCVSPLRRKAKYRQWDSLDYFGFPGVSATYWCMSYWDPGLAILSYQETVKLLQMCLNVARVLSHIP